MDTNVLGWAFYRGLRRHLGEWRQRQYRYAKKLWRVYNPEPPEGYICALCKNLIPPGEIKPRYRSHRVSPWELTIDHIIPVNAVLFGDYNLDIRLLFDPKNFQASHQYCNSKKGATYTHPLQTA